MVLATGCAQASGAPNPAPVPPDGWRALPELAREVAEAAKTDGIAIDGSEAWGGPAIGCFGVWLALRGSTEGFADQALASLAAAKLTVSDVTKSADGLTARFVRGATRGRLRARAEAGTVRALACFGTGREPAACDATCGALIGKL